MARSSNQTAAKEADAQTPEQGPDDLPLDLTELSLEELMDVPVRGAPRVRSEDALVDGGGAAAEGLGAGQDGLDELPRDLTALSLAQLMNLPVRAPGPLEEVALEQEQQDPDRDYAESDVATRPTPNGGSSFDAAGLVALAQKALIELASADSDEALDEDALLGDAPAAENFTVSTLDGYDDDPHGSAELAAPITTDASGDVATDASGDEVLLGDPGEDAPPPANSAPTAGADSATTNEDSALTLSVLGNDGDIDGDPLSVASVTQGANGAVVINADDTLTYTPNADFNGTDAFTYTVSDGQGGTDWATVNVTVGAVNDNPTAGDDSATTNEDSALTLSVLGNDGDIDGDPLNVTSATQGANGAVVINPDDTLTYTPNADFNGADAFTYTVSDGNGGTATATVNITVNPVNDAPTAGADAASTNEDTAVTVNVLVNDIDIDGDALSVSGVTQGTDGTVVVNPDGTVTYTPNLGYTGADAFTYTVDDGNGGTDTATVNVTVDPTNLIEGTPGDDELEGTSGDDTILGYGGDDELDGEDGDDTLYGGTGADELEGGDGDDTLYGGTGADELEGGDGDDILIWDANDTEIEGGEGMDTLRVAGGDADLTAFSGEIEEVEQVDLETDTGANSLILTAQDVLDISDTDIVTVLGGANDSVNAGTGWTDGGVSGGNHIYTQLVGPDLATLLVDTDVAVNPDITT